MELLLRRAATVSAWGVGALLLPYFLVGRGMIDLVFGPGFERGYVWLLLLAVAHAYGVAAGSPGWVLQMTGRQQTVMRVTVSTVVVKAAMVSLGAWGFAAIGVAAASLVSTVGQNTALMIVTRRQLGVRSWSWLNPLRALAAAPSAGAPSVSGSGS
jgi:O-antigen/teichoic acid export membrane protein